VTFFWSALGPTLESHLLLVLPTTSNARDPEFNLKCSAQLTNNCLSSSYQRLLFNNKAATT
jgi:hypothetical protein